MMSNPEAEKGRREVKKRGLKWVTFIVQRRHWLAGRNMHMVVDGKRTRLLSE